MFVENLGAPWSSGAWGPGPNGPVVNTPLAGSLGLACQSDMNCYTERMHRIQPASIPSICDHATACHFLMLKRYLLVCQLEPIASCPCRHDRTFCFHRQMSQPWTFYHNDSLFHIMDDQLRSVLMNEDEFENARQMLRVLLFLNICSTIVSVIPDRPIDV